MSLLVLLREHAPAELIGKHVDLEVWHEALCFRDGHGELWRVTWADSEPAVILLHIGADGEHASLFRRRQFVRHVERIG